MASSSLYQHYLEYLTSPPVLLTLWLILIPVLLERYKDSIRPPSLQPIRPPRCFRLGLRKGSNIAKQYQTQTPSKRQSSIGGDHLTGSPRVQALFTYPLKSCSGVELAASEVGATGLKYDRLFTFAQSLLPKATTDETHGDEKRQWQFVTQREFPKLALLKTELWVPDPRSKDGADSNGPAKSAERKRGRTKSRDKSPSAKTELTVAQKRLEEDWATNGGCLVVRFPHKPAFNPFGLRTETVELRIPLGPTPQRAAAKAYCSEHISIWKDNPWAINVTGEIDSTGRSKLEAFLGVKNPLALFRVSDRDQRTVTRSLPQDRPDESCHITFADAFPIHVVTLASIRAVDSALPKSASMKGQLDARRFRANVYVTGPSAFAEDGWKRFTLGRCIAPRAEAARDRSPVRDPTNAMVETDGVYHVACRTARCTLPNTDPATGAKDKNEPYSTLGKTRVVDEGAKPHSVLGLHVIPLFAQGLLRVGDDVEVLERGEHVYEKMFPT